MSTNKHTPEWIVSKLTPCRVDTPDGSISVSWSSNCDGGECNRKAEDAARLIAAAPELLENLIGCAEALASHYPDCTEVQCAREAIAKATGESL